MKMTELPAHQLVIHQTFVLQKHTVLKESEICTDKYSDFSYIFSLFWHTYVTSATDHALTLHIVLQFLHREITGAA